MRAWEGRESVKDPNARERPQLIPTKKEGTYSVQGVIIDDDIEFGDRAILRRGLSPAWHGSMAGVVVATVAKRVWCPVHLLPSEHGTCRKLCQNWPSTDQSIEHVRLMFLCRCMEKGEMLPWGAKLLMR